MTEVESGSQGHYALTPASGHSANVKPSSPSVYARSLDLTEKISLDELVHVIDGFRLVEFTATAASYGQEHYGYVVTPNVDHLIRYYDDSAFRAHYRAADFILMDSRFAACLVRLLKGIRIPVCTGSDLTAQLLANVVQPTDRLIMIGCSDAQAQQLAVTYGLTNVRHHNPPMGFIEDATSVEACLTFIESASPFRFCFLAVGSPQQETIAYRLRLRGVARGMVLCVGAALNFLTGIEKRAPVWMQRIALEWLYRLVQNPKRLARRYLVRGPRIFAHLLRTRVVVRNSPDMRAKPSSQA